MIKKSSAYIPFARKYRPTNFGELLGQEVLVKTLSYCIKNKRLAQAYLLAGIRGVGKTSSARIIAKTVNCTNKKEIQNFVTPCENCKNCESFNNHNHPDIIEIDAASRTSVDDIREIIESSEYRPLLGAMKFFIIDEIHMLSKSAFNALLKVVEEPPEHITFIFATTEVQKIPLTVISRCQRYDLKRLDFDELYTLIKNIAQNEGLEFEEEALKIIALQSEGSARDATSMLDQAASYSYYEGSKNIITTEIVSRMLGLLKLSTIINFTKLIIANAPKEALNLLDKIYADSNSIESFIQAMSDFFAELTKSKIMPSYHNPLHQGHSNEITDILIGTSLSRLTIIWQIFNNGIQEIKQSHNELICAQMLVIKAIYSCNIPTLEEILGDEEDNITLESNIDNIKTPNINKPANDLPDTNYQDKAKLTCIENEDKIFEFLRFCHTNKELDIYYVLLNEVEINSFAENNIQLIGNIKPLLQSQLEKLLYKWSKVRWKITVKKSDKIFTLKDKMLEKVKISGDYQAIKNNFPDANISDILLNL